MSVLTMEDLLANGVHFGHKTRRWNPRMARFIYGARNEIHIFDLRETIKAIDQAHAYLSSLVARGGRIIFVGTKRQARNATEQIANETGQFYVIERWLGGTLTNFDTIKLRLQRLRELRIQEADGAFDDLAKRDRRRREIALERLERKMGGIAHLAELPHALVVVDPNREANAVREARGLGIPVVALVDSNCDPDTVDLAIPGNDDSLRSVGLVLGALASGITPAWQAYESARVEREHRERAERERQEQIRRDLARKKQALLQKAAAAKLEQDVAAGVEVTPASTTDGPATPQRRRSRSRRGGSGRGRGATRITRSSTTSNDSRGSSATPAAKQPSTENQQ